MDSTGAPSTLGDPVLDSGAQLFSVLGWESTTIEAVAEEAKRPLPEVLQRFPSRDYLAAGIFEAVLRRTAIEFADEIDDDAGLHARLYALIANQLRPLEPYKMFVRELLQQVAQPFSAAAALQAPMISRYLALASEQFQVARARGEIWLLVVPTLAAAAFWALHLQIIWFWLNDDSDGSERTHAAADRRLAIFIRTLGGTPTTLDPISEGDF